MRNIFHLTVACFALAACAGSDATTKLNIVPTSHCENFDRYHWYTKKDIEKETYIAFNASFSQHPESPRLLNVNIIEVLNGPSYRLDDDVALLGEIDDTPVLKDEIYETPAPKEEEKYFIPTYLEFHGVKTCRMYLKVRSNRNYTVHLNYYGDPIYVEEH